MRQGKVSFVGAGPGDPELITRKGLRLLNHADVVIYDRLSHPMLLTEVKKNAKLVYCGKQPCKHSLRQEDIQKELKIHAKKGKHVVRLKGGDPSVFGRVGEEAEVMAEEGIPYEIVPGITSGVAVPAYAGIPVTHRDYSSSFTVVTGHAKNSEQSPNLDWESLAGNTGTIAFYMSMRHLDEIMAKLMEHGKSPHTPAITIEWGTYGRQRSVRATVSSIAAKVKQSGLSNPAITLVGEVIKLQPKLQWFESHPLSGKSVIMPVRTEVQQELAAEWREQGAEVFEFKYDSDDSDIKQGEKLAFQRLIEEGHATTIYLENKKDMQYLFYHLASLQQIQKQLSLTVLSADSFLSQTLRQQGFNVHDIKHPFEAKPFWLGAEHMAEGG